MNTKRIRKQAEELLGSGYSRQHAFDGLMRMHPAAKPKQVADVVRYIPTLIVREKYRSGQQALLFAIAVFGLLQLVRAWSDGRFDGAMPFRLIGALPIAIVVLGYGVYRWRGEVFQWIAWVNLWGGFSLINGLSAMVKGKGVSWGIGLGALSLGIGALAWYLSNRLFPEYGEEKDPLGMAPTRIVFPPEPGMMIL